MCLCCSCPSTKCCTFTAAICTALQGSLLAILNICIVSACTCSIDPPDNLSAQFMKKLWSWFIYDENNCKSKYDSFEAPEWVEDVPEDFLEANVWNKVDQDSTFAYQIVYIVLHIVWFFTALLLFFGAARHHCKLYIPWILVTISVVVLDTTFGSFYIRLMSETNPGWDDGQAIFAMQFLYFRGFVFYIYNIIALCFVFVSFCKTYDKEKRRNQLITKIGKENVTVQQQIIINTPPPQQYQQPQQYQLPGPQNPVPPLAYANPQPVLDIPSSSSQQPQRPVAPTKFRPFSYTSPEYRPTHPSDIEGMKSNTHQIFSPTEKGDVM